MKKNISFNDDQKEVFRFVIIVAVIALIILVIYLASYFATKKNVYHYDTSKEGEVSTDVVTIGTMFNKDEEEYYVAIYKNDDVNAIYYSALFNKYMGEEKSLNIYFCDLNNKLNEDYYSEKSNPKAKTIKDLKVGDFTFVKIKDGKITKYLESIEKVKEELGI